MTMTPTVRRFALTVHIAMSVSWIGAIAAFLALSIAGLASADAAVIRGAYVAMNLTGLYVIIPLSFAALATGLAQALGTPWGLVQHYWVLTKLLLTLLAAGLLVLHQYTIVAETAVRVLATPTETPPSAGRAGVQLLADSSLAILALLTVTALAVFKPRGLTGYGRRERQAQRQSSTAEPKGASSLGRWIFLSAIAAVVVVFLVVHAAGLAGGHAEAFRRAPNH